MTTRALVSWMFADWLRAVPSAAGRWLKGNVGSAATIASLLFVGVQIGQSTKAARIEIRGQLYAGEFQMSKDEESDTSGTISDLWTGAPPDVSAERYGAHLLSRITTDRTVINAVSADDLLAAVFGTGAEPRPRSMDANNLRRMYLFTQRYFYHIHNAHDYWREGIVADGEWLTWKGILKEMQAHPMLLAVIANGASYQYFSRPFASFLQEEICPSIGDDPVAVRNCAFAQRFYPDMFADRALWLRRFPDY